MFLAQSTGKNALHSPIPVRITESSQNHRIITESQGLEGTSVGHLVQPSNHVYVYQQPTPFSSATACQAHPKSVLPGQISVGTTAPLASRTERPPIQENGAAQAVPLGCHSTENTDLNNSMVRQGFLPKRHLFPSELGLFAIFIVAVSFSLCKQLPLPSALLSLRLL